MRVNDLNLQLCVRPSIAETELTKETIKYIASNLGFDVQESYNLAFAAGELIERVIEFYRANGYDIKERDVKIFVSLELVDDNFVIQILNGKLQSFRPEEVLEGISSSDIEISEEPTSYSTVHEVVNKLHVEQTDLGATVTIRRKLTHRRMA